MDYTINTFMSHTSIPAKLLKSARLQPEWGQYGTDEWSEKRYGPSGYVGCSEVAAIMGLSPWSGPFSVAALRKGLVPPIELNDVMTLGHLVEPVIFYLWRLWAGKNLEIAGWWRPNFTFEHRTVPHFGASLDGAALLADGRKAVVECKHASGRASAEIKDLASGEAVSPAMQCHLIQVQAQLAVTGYEVGYLSILADKSHTVVEVARDEETIARIEAAVADFWATYVEGDAMPTPAVADLRDLDRQMATAEKTIERPDLRAAVESIRGLREEKKRRTEDLDTAIKQYEAEIKAAMGDAEIMTVGEDCKPVTWKATTRKAYTVAAKTYRTLRV